MNHIEASITMPKNINPNLVLFLRTLIFLLYIALIVLGVVITKTAAPLLALLLVYWVVDSITALLPTVCEQP